MSSAVPDDAPRPRSCHLKKQADFNGYGFNLHAEKGKAGQFIGKVDPGSPADRANLKEGDRIIEVNGTNIGNENHQQVVQRVKSVPDETKLLVVDHETDEYYKNNKTVIRGDMPNVLFLSNVEIQEPPPAEVVSNGAVSSRSSQEIPANAPQPRHCHLKIWEGFQGYGFNLHAEKGKPGQFIGSVDPNSPADLAGLKEGDRIVEVNGDNVSRDNHSAVVQKIKSDPNQTRMLVVDDEAEEYYREKEITVSSSLGIVKVIKCPDVQPKAENGAASRIEAEVNHVTQTEQVVYNEPEEEDVTCSSLPDTEDVENKAEDVAEYASVNKAAVAAVAVETVVKAEQQEDEQQEDEVKVTSTTEAEEAAEAISEMEKAVEEAEPQDDKLEYNNNTDVAQDYDVIANVPKPGEVEAAPQRDPSPEPVKREPSPEPVRAPTPEPVRAPTPEPVRPPSPKEPQTSMETPSSPNEDPITVGGITWGSAAEARQKMNKKRRDEVKSQNLSAKAKYELLMKM